MTDSVHTQLKSSGWAEISGITTTSDLFQIAENFGKIIPHSNGDLIFTLVPNDGSNALSGTHSHRYGFGCFPLHTDTAFWARPVRYILLCSLTKSETNSLLFNTEPFIDSLTEQEYNNAQKAIFIIKTNRGQHYSSLLFKENRTTGFRFDPSCMQPFNKASYLINEKLIHFVKQQHVSNFEWRGGSALIIDNWKALHGRSSVHMGEKREIKRIYIGNI